MKLYRREKYLSRIRGFYHDCGMIKVITGIRRCGKSSLMQTIRDELLENGVNEEQLLTINLDDKQYKNISTPDKLEAVIDSLSSNTQGILYLFIDEIQNVSGFEKLINSYRETGHYSIFITGSNSYLLSGELTTKLTGRYLEFELYPLTFDEYIAMKQHYGKVVDSSLSSEFNLYIKEGGFPKTVEYDNYFDKQLYVKNIVNEIFNKDIKARTKIKNVLVFNEVQKFLINNYACPFSVRNLHNIVKKNGLNIKIETLYRYIKILLDAKILYRCDRFDLKSKKSILGEQKYYLADLSLYFATNTDNRINYGPILENITYIYSLSQNYSVSIGRIGNFECDFILKDNLSFNIYAYVQVSMSILMDRETEDREYRPLENIRDNYPKFILTRDNLLQKRNGIKHENIESFFALGKRFE